MRWKELEYPSYSPDLPPCDFHAAVLLKAGEFDAELEIVGSINTLRNFTRKIMQ